MVFIVWNVLKVYCTIYSFLLPPNVIPIYERHRSIWLFYSYILSSLLLNLTHFVSKEYQDFYAQRKPQEFPPPLLKMTRPTTLSGTFFTPRSTYIPLPRQPTTNNPNCRQYFSHVHSFVHSFILHLFIHLQWTSRWLLWGQPLQHA